MMYGIHTQPYLEYKSGLVTGAASNCSKAAKTTHIFMMQSLLSAHKDVVYILPVPNIEAVQLHAAQRKTILQLKNAGLSHCSSNK